MEGEAERAKERKRPEIAVLEDELGVTVVVESRWVTVVVEAGEGKG